MKLIVSTAVALVLAGQAFAGNLVFEAPEEPVVVAEPAPMGGSNAAWLIVTAPSVLSEGPAAAVIGTRLQRREKSSLRQPVPRCMLNVSHTASHVSPGAIDAPDQGCCRTVLRCL